MIYDLVIREEASLDLLAGYFYYENKRSGLGDRFVRAVKSNIERIQNSPEQFPVKYREFRQVQISTFPYVIIYKIQNERIIVLSIFNTWRDPKRKPI